jgi:hypothetical protein
MDIHAINLRNKYEKLILLWSGGTDSHTIYNVFVRNNIHIDEIVVFHDDQFETYLPSSHDKWMRENHPDPLTVITSVKRFNPRAKELVINNEDWVFQDKGVQLKIGLGFHDDNMERHCDETYSGFTWALVSGLEQPTVYEVNNKWYARQESRPFGHAMKLKNLEFFFIEPLLVLKQAHMAKKVMKQIKQQGQLKTQHDFRRHSTAGAYKAWSKVMGRHDELLAGISYAQKQHNGMYYEAKIRIDGFADPEMESVYPALAALLKQGDVVAKNYVSGLNQLLSEREFCKFVSNTNTVNDSQGIPVFTMGTPIWSKSYYLGE